MARRPSRCLLLLVAALSLQLTGCTDDAPLATEGRAGSVSTAGTAASGPTTSAATSSAPFSLREYDGPVDPGRHRVPLISWERTYPVDALVQVPPGFITPGGWVIDNGEDGSAYGDLMFYGDVDLVDTDPCGAGPNLEPGPTVRDLAEALAHRVTRRATAPEPATVGGHRGLYVEMRVPPNLDRCPSQQFTVFAVNQAENPWYSAGPGSLLRFWIIDVDGQRVVVAVKGVPGRTAHATALLHMAQTARFVENADE